MSVTAQQVKELRDQTGISMMECKKALEEANGDMTAALEVLSRRSAEIAEKKSTRELGAGTIASYIHNGGQVGSLVLLSCETDFVSKNEEFVAIARDIAMHAAAMHSTDIEALLVEPFIKNPEITIAGLMAAGTQKFGERIVLSKLSVFSVQE